MEGVTPIVQSAGHDEAGVFGMYAGEEEYYVGLHWRWRNLAKPTIAQVQGRAMAGGLIAATLGLRNVFFVTAAILLIIGAYLPFGVKDLRTARRAGQ